MTYNFCRDKLSNKAEYQSIMTINSDLRMDYREQKNIYMIILFNICFGENEIAFTYVNICFNWIYT